MKLVNFALFSSFLFLLPGCITTPGIEEPKNVIICTILEPRGISECEDLTSGVIFRTRTSDLIGHSVISPRDYARLRNHHDAVHEELNFCRNSNPFEMMD